MVTTPGGPFAGASIPVPAFVDDDGRADPALRVLLTASVVDDEAVSALLLGARLLVPVVAVLESVQEPAADGLAREKDSHMATVSVVSSQGRRAMLAFTGTDALTSWDPQARPVAATAVAAARSALAEGAEAILLDTSSPHPHPVAGARLRALAEGRAWIPPARDPELAAAVYEALLGPRRHRGLGSVTAVRLLPDDGLTVVLEVDPVPDAAAAGTVAQAAVDALASLSVVSERCDSGVGVAVTGR